MMKRFVLLAVLLISALAVFEGAAVAEHGPTTTMCVETPTSRNCVPDDAKCHEGDTETVHSFPGDAESTCDPDGDGEKDNDGERACDPEGTAGWCSTQSVPSAGQWTLMGMAAVMLAAGGWRVRQGRAQEPARSR